MQQKLNPQDIEIMAPVGSYESLSAAIQGKADAVYFGIGHLNMRSRSTQNFSLEDLAEIAAICRENHLRSYITLNTEIFDEEISLMRAIVDEAKKAGITAIIASDQAVIQYARSREVEVHMSTQANITNTEAVKYYAQFADVMVTARELNLDQVKRITENIEGERIIGPSGKLVQIEVFAHGALCMAVSGKCYLSLDNMNSSANRGACLQLCRRPYRVFDRDGEVELEVDNQYIMSPKDLKTIDFIDKILDAGVRVLKIEGRGRSPEYVKTVTRCYREAVNAHCDGTFNPENLERWNHELGTVYNRGFWDGYYLGRKVGEWAAGYGSQATKKKIYVGKVMNYYARTGIAEVKIEAHPLRKGDHFLVLGPTTGVAEGITPDIWLDEKIVGEVNRGDLCTFPFDKPLRPSDKLYKWVDSREVEGQID
ncbi:MAG TPA: peptidase U32 family protein [Bacteroidales bacterium]|nr:peptidase U32 family protein [Bacteroidales bacterium]